MPLELRSVNVKQKTKTYITPRDQLTRVTPGALLELGNCRIIFVVISTDDKVSRHFRKKYHVKTVNRPSTAEWVVTDGCPVARSKVKQLRLDVVRVSGADCQKFVWNIIYYLINDSLWILICLTRIFDNKWPCAVVFAVKLIVLGCVCHKCPTNPEKRKMTDHLL